MLPAVLDPWAGARAVRSRAPGRRRDQGLARQPRPEGQTPAGHDDHRAEGALRAGRAGRPRLRLLPTPSRRRPPWPPRSTPSRASTASRLLVFGGWESASRGAGSTLQMVGERLGITEQFQGVDQIVAREDGSLRNPRADRRRPPPGVRLRRAPGGARLGHRPSARAAQQPAGRHG